MDFLAAFPWDICGGPDARDALRPVKALKLLRGVHLVAKQQTQIGKSVNIVRVFKVIRNFLVLAHWVACLWWVIGASETDLALFSAADLDDSGRVEEAEFVTVMSRHASLSAPEWRSVFQTHDANSDGALVFNELTAVLFNEYRTTRRFCQSYEDSWLQVRARRRAARGHPLSHSAAGRWRTMRSAAGARARLAAPLSAVPVRRGFGVWGG